MCSRAHQPINRDPLFCFPCRSASRTEIDDCHHKSSSSPWTLISRLFCWSKNKTATDVMYIFSFFFKIFWVGLRWKSSTRRHNSSLNSDWQIKVRNCCRKAESCCWCGHFFGPFCRIEIEEHHKKGQTTPVVQWTRKEVSNQEREMMYKEASGILQK